MRTLETRAPVPAAIIN